MDSIPAVLQTMMNLYEFSEQQLSQLLRWKRFISDQTHERWNALHRENNGVVLQPVSVHSYSLGVFVDFMVQTLRDHVTLDRELLQLCVRYHDFGEGLLGRDVPKPVKGRNHDIEEYQATMAFLRSLYGGSVPSLLESAYLLQHCLKNPPAFPARARRIMAKLAQWFWNEAYAFQIAEQFEYALYALRNRERAPDLFAEVFRNNVGDISKLAGHLPGCTELLWTPEVDAWFSSRLKELTPVPAMTGSRPH